MVDAFYLFSYFSGSKPNLIKPGIAGIGDPERGSSNGLWFTLYRSK